MATKHLLTCACGKELVVETHQAGEQVACECGAMLPIPALRQMWELPVAPESEPERESNWSFRHGVLTTGLLVALALGVGGAYVLATEPPPPAEYSAVQRNENFAAGIETFTPSQTYRMWTERYQLLDKVGFTQMSDRRRERMKSYVGRVQALRTGLFAASGIVAVVSLVAFTALPSGKKSADAA